MRQKAGKADRRGRTARFAGFAAAAVAVSLLTAPAAVAVTSVNENFEDGTADGFTAATGAYSVVTDGTKVYKTTSATARAVFGDAASTNTEVQADVKVATWSTSTDRTAGLMARYTDTNNYYMFIYEDGRLKIRKKIGGTITDVTSKAFTLNTGTWYTFKGSVSGSAATMWVNGSQELTGTVSGLSAGKAGLLSFNGDVRYDNVVANDLAGPPTTLDAFGLKKLNPSVGKEWFSNWRNGNARTYNGNSNLSVDPELVMSGGEFTADIYGSSGTRAGQMRVYGDYPRVYVRKSDSTSVPPGIPATDKWNNVEITYYAYSTGDSGVGWAGLEAVAKTNHWPDSWQCTSGGYGARMLFDGRVDFEKELYHDPNTNFQAATISNYWTSAEGSVGGKLPLNRWIGFKFVARNIDAGNDGNWQNDTQVRLELYKEMSIGNVTNPSAPAGGGNWVLVNSYTDNGNLSSGTPCTKVTSPDDDPYGAASKAFTWPNYSVYLRTDGLTSSIPQYYQWFSVREVAPIPAS
ncbi:hypothetical protein [Dactylosporangium sp. CA-233914]|uniref:hypothetical protein n=1 Tax=Dactylosporangium sp. CA-233914 TaxID=3239934 RepID=UPI003D9098B1